MRKKSPSFEEAINAASLWCTAWEQGELSDEVLADRVSELLETRNGSRGFLHSVLQATLLCNSPPNHETRFFPRPVSRRHWPRD